MLQAGGAIPISWKLARHCDLSKFRNLILRELDISSADIFFEILHQRLSDFGFGVRKKG
jgi:hypothetical protein